MMDRLETRVPPLVWLLVFAGVILGISTLDLGWEVAGGGGSVGLLVGLIGLFIAALGVVDVVGEGTTVDPNDLSKTNTLVTKGVYRLSRNPMYLGMAIVLLGLGLGLEDPLAAIVGVGGFVVVITRLQIIPEERALLKRFPSAYPQFQQRTRRWL